MSQVIKLQSTELNNSYWNNSGAYQAEYSELYKKLVPSQGKAETVHGELIRSVSRLFYEYCNNGNGNAADIEIESYDADCECGNDPECEICGGSGKYMEDEIAGINVSEFFQYFIDFIENNIKDKINPIQLKAALIDVERVICKDCEGIGADYFNARNMNIYNRVTDMVMYYVLNSENTPLAK